MGGSLLVIGGTGRPRPGVGLAIISADTAALPGDGREPRSGARPDPGKPIASGIVDSPSPQRWRSATSSTRHASDRTRRRRAARGVHVKTNTALTGATDDVEGA